MKRWEKVFWALLCGTALGVAGCGDDDTGDMYGPPPDATGDGTPDVMDVADDVSEETIEDVTEEEPLATAYGPVADV
jgi:hypothetical protein